MVTRSALPQNYRTLTTLCEMDNALDWTAVVGPSGSFSAASTRFGDAIQIISMSSGGTAYKIDKTVSYNFGGVAPTISFWLHIDDISLLASGNSFYVRLSKAADFSSYFNNSFYGGTLVDSLHSGWNFCTINANAWGSSGSTTWNDTFIRIRIGLIAKTAGVAVTAQVCDLSVATDIMPSIIVFDFDNAHETVYHKAFPIFQAAGIPANTGVVSGHVGEEVVYDGTTYQYMSLEHLQELYAAGWDVNNHTVDHVNLSALDYENNLTQLGGCKTWLETNGFTRSSDYFIAPFGGISTTTIDAMDALGIVSARTANLSIVDAPIINLNRVFSLQYQPAHELREGGDNSLADALATIDAMVSMPGSILHIYFHDVVDSDPATSYDILTSNLQSLIDYVLSKGPQLQVKTNSELYIGLTNPRYRSLPLGR